MLETVLIRLRSAVGGGASYAPMSNPFPLGSDGRGRGTPRWSAEREVLASAAFTAGLLPYWIAMVGVSPGELSCKGPN